MFRFEFRELSNASFEVLKRKFGASPTRYMNWLNWTAAAAVAERSSDRRRCRRLAAVDSLDGQWVAGAQGRRVRMVRQRLFVQSAIAPGLATRNTLSRHNENGFAGPVRFELSAQSQCVVE